MKTSIVVLWATLFIPASAPAQSDPLLQAVAFALTGSDNAKVRAIDRANCVFGINNEVFRLNNVHIDRVTTAEGSYGGLKYLLVELHGSTTVHEATVEPSPALQERPNDPENAKEFIKQLKKDDPAAFQRRHTKSNEHKIVMYTTERDRVIRAWQYIYAHGCTGAKSPV